MSSTLYTIGTALRRAHDGRLHVDLLVETHWLEGRVVAVDGHGVILELENTEVHSVVRLESVSAVRVHGAAPADPTTDRNPSADADAAGQGALLPV
jgi:hypothetical protein